jgi:hypothetical protein
VMKGLHSLRNSLVDGPGSVGERKRSRRWTWLAETFPDIDSMAVIDLGGTAEAWKRAPLRPASVHVVNLDLEAGDQPEWLRTDQADACDLPAHIRGGHYDLVLSNSVMEHVGGHAQRLRFADAVRNLAPRHWVQTPYRYFPIEPHWLFPGFQFLPLTIRAELSRRWPLVHTPSSSREEGLTAAMWVELISRTEMAAYFPESTIRAERMLGMVKSLIATKAK